MDLGGQSSAGPARPPAVPLPPPPPIAPAAAVPAGTSLAAVGIGDGAAARFTLHDARTFSQLANVVPYDESLTGGVPFTGGIRTATGDFDADGVADVVVGPGPGNRPWSGSSAGRTCRSTRSARSWARGWRSNRRSPAGRSWRPGT